MSAGRTFPQLRKLTLFYSPASGSSNGVREFIEFGLRATAEGNPHVVVEAKPLVGHRHPYLRGEWLNGKKNTVGLKNMKYGAVADHILKMTMSSGAKANRPVKPIITKNPSIQGNWGPLGRTGTHVSGK